MSTGEHRFRSAAFGFHRQDVIEYVESIHRDHAAQLEALKKELADTQSRLTAAEEARTLAENASEAAGREARQARGELAEAVTQLQEAREENRLLQMRARTAEKDLDDLQRAADRMAPAARSYEVLKEKAASIELDAHNRAQTIIKAGEAQAEQTRRAVQTWLEQVRSSYLRLKTDMEATLSHTRSELERAGQSLEQVNRELEGHGARLEAISAALEPPKADGGTGNFEGSSR